MKYYEDHVIDERKTFPRQHELTEEEIIRFAKQWDPQPFHVDKESAEKSYFGGIVACTAHLFGITSKLPFPDANDWAVVSSLASNNLKNRAPARPGDLLSLTATCIGKRKSESKSGLGILEYYVELINQKDEVVFSYLNASLHELRPGS